MASVRSRRERYEGRGGCLRRRNARAYEERRGTQAGDHACHHRGEETGCEGAFHLARQGALGPADLLIVAEPSSNLPIIAHKGSVRLRISAKGKSAHSSLPEFGDNAIYKITKLDPAN